MVFSSLFFLYGFLAVAILSYFIVRDIKYRNTVLCLLSLFFYAWGEPKWVILLLAGCLIDYIIGISMEKWRQKRILSGFLLFLSVALNIATIGVFKYSGFMAENLNGIFGTALSVPYITLPIGISFFTFQKLSYTIDVYRGNVKAQRSYVNFVLYISMFFQLIAGPIVRYSWVETEMSRRSVNVNEFARGVRRFCFGLGKKVVFANAAGAFVDKYMLAPTATLTTAEAWFGVLMFSLQIYYDFSGYSDMAIGLGRMFGFHFPENFKYPYASLTVTDFWRRWHISLSSFFRDYVYIPLGGNRRHMLVNILVVWTLTGLWHGASWNFVLWGLFYGILLLIEKYFILKPIAKLKKALRASLGAFGSFINLIIATVQKAAFIFITLMGWTLFYFEETDALVAYVKVMFGGITGSAIDLQTLILNNLYWLIAAIIFTLPVVRIVKYLAYKAQRRFALFAYTNELIGGVFAIVILLVSTASLVGNSFNPFLYFRY